MNYLQKTLDIVFELCDAFDDLNCGHQTRPCNQEVYQPNQLQGGTALWSNTGNPCMNTNVFSPIPKLSLIPLKGKGQKAAEAKPHITELLSNRTLLKKEIPFNFEARLQKFSYLVAVIPPLESGLIPSENLTVSGDGTAVYTHASPRGHRSKDAPASDDVTDPSPRHFSNPDASWGWDSDFDRYYYGYTLFQFSCYNSELHTDLLLLFRFTSAKRHDSVNALIAFQELEKHMRSLSIKTCALILPWTIFLLIDCLMTGR